MEELFESNFVETATISQHAKEGLRKFCSVHYKGNVEKVSNTSKAVDSWLKIEFKKYVINC
jgi:hypothetical protein